MSVYTTNYVFRLLFNGEILTHLIQGCPPESQLCDMKIFTDLVNPMATRTPDCGAPITYVADTAEPEEQPVIVMEQAKSLMSTREGILLFFGLVLVSAIVGALGAFVLLTGRLPFTKRKLMTSVVEEDSEAGRGLRERGFEDEYMNEGAFLNPTTNLSQKT